MTIRRCCLSFFALFLIVGLTTPAAQAKEGEIQLAQLFGKKKDTETIVRVNRIEEQMRSLTGQIEEMSYQLRQMQDQMRRLQEDMEYRLQVIEGGNPQPRQRSEAPAAQPAPGASGTVASANDTTVQNLGDLQLEPGAQGQASDGGGGRPLDLGAIADGQSGTTPQANRQAVDNNQVATAAPAAGGGRGLYDEAYGNLLNGNYPGAQQQFTQFLADNPNDPLAANAQYWLGESYYARGLYREAADAFLKSYSDYPNTEKVGESLLKLGLSLNGMGEQQAACATYSELLQKYPNAPASLTDRAKAEKDRAGCG
ncbi:MAG: tol-pal system protein YbgF [Stappiaceae bacterium]